MEASAYFARLLRPPGLRTSRSKLNVAPDDLQAFDEAWTNIQGILTEPDEGQLLRGIHSTDVPQRLEWLVKALVHESDAEEKGSSTGECLENFLSRNILAQLVKLSEADRPFGIKAEVLNAINTLLLLLPDSFLVHSAIHRPLLRLIRSSISPDTVNSVDGSERILGAAIVDSDKLKGKEESEKVTEGRLVDLLCILCAKVQAYPLLLLVLFHDRLSPHAPSAQQASQTSYNNSSHNPSSTHLDYLILSYLLRYVHYDGRIGVCARTGANCLFDIAFGSPQVIDYDENGEEGQIALKEARVNLAEQIFHGDSGDVIAAGLGAVYSVLPFKVRLPTAEEANQSMEGGMHLGLNPEKHPDSFNKSNLLSFQNNEIQHQLGLLVETCQFVDGIIIKCRAATIDSSKLDDRIKTIASALVDQLKLLLKLSFLDNVLYPSILECSSADGSATAVLSYLRVLLCTEQMDHGKDGLATQILTYLLGLEELTKNDLLGTGPARTTYGHLTARFTLRDLFVDAIDSNASEAATAALNLFSGLLDNYCDLSTFGLLSCIEDEEATSFSKSILSSSHKIPGMPVQGEYGRMNRAVIQTEEVDLVDSLTRAFDGLAATPGSSPFKISSPRPAKHPDADLYSGLVVRLLGQRDDANTAAASVYLADGYASLCDHTCFQRSLSAVDMPRSSGDKGAPKPSRYQGVGAYRLDPTDVVLQELLKSLRHFFSHTAEYNVALTGALSSLANCPCRCLRGWLLKIPAIPAAADRTLPSLKAEPQDVFTDDNPFQDDSEDRLPILYQTLRELTKQVSIYRTRVPDFNRLLGERRRGLHYVEGMEDAVETMLDIVPTQTAAPGWTPQREELTATESPPSLQRSRTSTFSATVASFLTPRKKTLNGAADSNPTSPFSFLARYEDSTPATPLKSHYQRTTAVVLEPLAASEPITGMWTPDRKGPMASQHDKPISWTESVSDSIGGSLQPLSQPSANDGFPQQVTLSQILDNCVVLEEFIKEMIGHITARHTLGID